MQDKNLQIHSLALHLHPTKHIYKYKIKTMRRTIFQLAAVLTISAGMFSCNCGTKCEPSAEPQDKTEAIIQNIMTRTSVRAYTDQAIGKDTIEAILKAGMAAPTAVNAQPWHFVAVTNRALIDSLAACNPNARMLQQAPLAIAVCGDMTKAMEGKGREFWVQDCSAATENILLAVHAYGLGAVWTGAYPINERVESISHVLQLPETIIPLCVIVVGHPAERPEPKDKWKTENVTYYE